jgi:hypothetical protein
MGGGVNTLSIFWLFPLLVSFPELSLVIPIPFSSSFFFPNVNMILLLKKYLGATDMAYVVENLPSQHKALSSNPIMAKQNIKQH